MTRVSIPGCKSCKCALLCLKYHAEEPYSLRTDSLVGPIAAWFDIIDVVSNRDGAGAWLNDMLGSNEDPGPCVSLRASSVGSLPQPHQSSQKYRTISSGVSWSCLGRTMLSSVKRGGHSCLQIQAWLLGCRYKPVAILCTESFAGCRWLVWLSRENPL